MHISFICKGNICRSPMAASIARTYLGRAGLAGRVTVSSAGIEGWNAGSQADARAVAVLARHGYPGDHRAAQVNATHLGADLLVAMDEGQKNALAKEADPARIRLLREFAAPRDGEDLNVPDPYEGEIADFEVTLQLIEAAMPGLISWIRQALAEPGGVSRQPLTEPGPAGSV
ncbi:low molecular weight protein-tyrosine-phosphatase [Nonomuraea sp. NPDC052265]|uniref:low molecular weight protein-tyrosine-phosphatase n=1 Tax=Nonomuraea sp. NPDC052265 TaxID=3364374 RepID=UPI0037C6BBA4